MGRASNRQILTGGSQIYARKKSRKNQPVEEVNFDREARKEFLTGFHKRKVERKEKAVERAKEAEKEQKREEKRLMKQERLRAAQKDLERYEKQISDLVARDNSDYESESEGDNKKKEEVVEKKAEGSEEDFSDWEGMETNGKPAAIGILKRRNKYQDDDGETTTVTIESMDFNESDSDDKVHIDKAVDLSRSEKVLKSSLERAEMSAKAVAHMNSKRNKRVQKVNKLRQSRVSKKRR